MKRIVYLHGFNSSPQSIKARQLEVYLGGIGLATAFSCPALPHQPAQAMALIESHLAGADSKAVTLIGSSLGGFYALALAERFGFKAILVNPSVAAHVSLARRIGPQTNLYTGEQYDFTTEHLEQLRQLLVLKPTRLERYWLMVETGDEVLDYREATAQLQGARLTVIDGGDHAFGAWLALLPCMVAFSGNTHSVVMAVENGV